jgi:hypothetical protein
MKTQISFIKFEYWYIDNFSLLLIRDVQLWMVNTIRSSIRRRPQIDNYVSSKQFWTWGAEGYKFSFVREIILHFFRSVHVYDRLALITNLMHNSFIYNNTLHYNPRHVSSNTMLILRRSNYIDSAFDIVTVQPLKTVTIPDAETIQFDLLRMSVVLLETCRGL